MPGLLRTYADRRLLTVLALGFSSGLPLLLTGRTLQAWLSDAQVDLTTIGYAGLIGLPYTLKFLWAPLLDAWAPPGFGRRRGWLLASQLALAAGLLAMGLHDPGRDLKTLAALAALVALWSATQDVVVDAYRLEILPPERYGAGAAVGILGYRLGMLAAGAAALLAADAWGWRITYALMGAGMLVGLAATLAMPEPPVAAAPRSLRAAVVQPLADWFARHRWSGGLLILGFVCIYKLDDALAQALVMPFLKDAGFTKTHIGTIQGGLGLVATIVGALAGGAVVGRIGVERALWVLGAAQALGVLAYAWLAWQGGGLTALTITVCIENLGAGLGTAAFIAYLMGRCNPAFGATQYALLSSLMGAGRTLLAAPAGALVVQLGLSWPAFFLLSAAAGLPGLALLWWVAPWRRQVADG
jgi:PAT family beta-lactamase induction signal transducer AmpG